MNNRSDFPVLPTEALLLGLCVGEYQSVNRHTRVENFMDILKRRLLPYFDRPSCTWPSFISPYNGANIPSHHLKGLEWHKPSDHVLTGDDKSTWGNFAYAVTKTSAPTILAKPLINWWNFFPDETPRPMEFPDVQHYDFFDHLVNSLSGTLQISFTDALLYPAVSRPAAIQQAHDALTQAITEDVEAIVRKCGQLVDGLPLQTAFDCGTIFGHLLASVVDFRSHLKDPYDELIDHGTQLDIDTSRLIVQLESHITDLEDRIEDCFDSNEREQLRQELSRLEDLKEQKSIEKGMIEIGEFEIDSPLTKENARKLLDLPMVQACFHAEQLLLSLFAEDTALQFDYRNYQFLDRRLEHATLVIWLSFGELLGFLRESDQQVWLADAENYIANPSVIGVSDTPDRLHERLLELQASLYSAKRQERPAHKIMLIGVPYIEALTKRIWPEAFIRQERTVAYILRMGIEDRDRHRKEFAELALLLHRKYRNPLVHELDQRSFTEIDARLFIAGLMKLVELWKTICWPQ